MHNFIVDVEGNSISITTTWNSHRVAFLGEPESRKSAALSFQTVHRIQPGAHAGPDYEVTVFSSPSVSWIIRRDGQVLSSKRPAVYFGWLFTIIAALRLTEYLVNHERSDLGIAALNGVVAVLGFVPYVLWKRQMHTSTTRATSEAA